MAGHKLRPGGHGTMPTVTAVCETASISACMQW